MILESVLRQMVRSARLSAYQKELDASYARDVALVDALNGESTMEEVYRQQRLEKEFCCQKKEMGQLESAMYLTGERMPHSS